MKKQLRCLIAIPGISRTRMVIPVALTAMT